MKISSLLCCGQHKVCCENRTLETNAIFNAVCSRENRNNNRCAALRTVNRMEAHKVIYAIDVNSTSIACIHGEDTRNGESKEKERKMSGRNAIIYYNMYLWINLELSAHTACTLCDICLLCISALFSTKKLN